MVKKSIGYSMKIALVSYEYPPDTSYGGISTYVYQAAHMLVKAGHLVEVFTASPTRTGSCQESGINVHRIACIGSSDYALAMRLHLPL